MIYIYDDISGFSADHLAIAIELLPPERKEKCLSYKNLIDRKISCLSYLLLCYALKKEYGITSFSIGTNENGKPYLIDYPFIHFNISHCKSSVVLGLDRKNIGVDVESLDVYNCEIARCVLSNEEYRMLNDSLDKPYLFVWFWTRKEAYQKYTGEGLIDNMKDVLHNSRGVHFFSHANQYSKTILSTCTSLDNVSDNRIVTVECKEILELK